MQFWRNVSWLNSTLNGAARSHGPLLLVFACSRQASVPPDTPVLRSGSPAGTTWLPRSCSPSDMSEATMQLGPDTGDTSGAEVTEAPPAPARCPAADQAL